MLREALPDFEVRNGLEEGIYSIAGDFAIALRDGIVEKTLSEEQINHAFAALNRIGQIEDFEVQNLLTMGALEILTDDAASIRTARQKLNGRALELFEDIKLFWHGPEPGNA